MAQRLRIFRNVAEGSVGFRNDPRSMEKEIRDIGA